MPTAQATSYEELPYGGSAYPESHPRRLGALAWLAGLAPPALGPAWVLELGCAEGDNLLPLAADYPEATFTGIDLSAWQIEVARQAQVAAGLANVRLECRSIVDIGADLGTYDYIVCHGVYSWVPAAVRERILWLCRQRLAPNGVAYVSYNTWPGWLPKAGRRELLRYHSRHAPDATARVAAALSAAERPAQ